MDQNLKDILSHLNPDIDQETLLLYLQGKLTAEKQHELEMKIIENDFEGDAMEGLYQLKDKQKIALIIEQLNSELQKKTTIKKKRRNKLRLKEEPWLWLTIIIILLLIVISYLIIHFSLKQS
jgi:type IV secretory pathway component VirB8